MRKPPLVIYHGPTCLDGFTAAWVFKQFMPDTQEFFPRQYNDAEPMPDVKGREVWILDFCFPRETLKEIITASERTILLDHHKTAKADIADIIGEMRASGIQRTGVDKLVFDMGRSGAGMTFDHLEEIQNKKKGYKLPRHNGARPNWLVDYVEDRDLWRQVLPGCREVNAYLGSQPMTFDSWSRILSIGKERVIQSGEGIVQYIDSYGEKAVATARIEMIGGYAVPTMTLAYMNCSEHVGRLLEKYPDSKFAASYFRRADGKWQFSLRSRNDFDVSEVAKSYGGGGHAGAAGFETLTLPWEQRRQGAPGPA